MPINTKEQIAEAAMTLLMDKNVKKLTVKNIVEECGITGRHSTIILKISPSLPMDIREKRGAYPGAGKRKQ